MMQLSVSLPKCSYRSYIKVSTDVLIIQLWVLEQCCYAIINTEAKEIVQVIFNKIINQSQKVIACVAFMLEYNHNASSNA